MHYIHFSVEDAEIYGNGWSVANDKTVVNRFHTLAEAKHWCTKIATPYLIANPDTMQPYLGQRAKIHHTCTGTTAKAVWNGVGWHCQCGDVVFGAEVHDA